MAFIEKLQHLLPRFQLTEEREEKYVFCVLQRYLGTNEHNLDTQTACFSVV